MWSSQEESNKNERYERARIETVLYVEKMARDAEQRSNRRCKKCGALIGNFNFCNNCRTKQD